MLRLICAPIRCCRECSPLCVRRFFVVRSRIAGLCGFGDIARWAHDRPNRVFDSGRGFPSNGVLSPDGSNFAVVSQDGAAIDILDTRESQMVERLKAPAASDLTWTTDGLFVSLGYTGKIAHYTVTPGSGKRADRRSRDSTISMPAAPASSTGSRKIPRRIASWSRARPTKKCGSSIARAT